MHKLGQLQKYVFADEHLAIDSESKKILDNLMPQIFTDEKDIQQSLEKLKRKDRWALEKIDTEYLPFHLRDEVWMMNLINKKLNNYRNALSTSAKTDADITSVKEISMDMIRSYMRRSDVYRKQRAKYEDRLVKAYLINLRDSEKDDFQVRGFEKKAYRNHPEYDRLYRLVAVKAMRYLSMHESVYEPLIEKHADVWHDQVCRQTFENRFYFMDYLDAETIASCKQIFPERLKEIQMVYEDAYQTWKKYRDSIYYKENDSVLKKVKVNTENKKLTDTEESMYYYQALEKGAECERLIFAAKQLINKIMINKSKSKVNGNCIDFTEEQIKKCKELYWETNQPNSNDNYASFEDIANNLGR